MWTHQSALPDDEPCATNLAEYTTPQLLAGTTNDGDFIYDVIYDVQAACFVLTALHINQDWGFVEAERRVLLPTRTALLDEIAHLESDAQKWITQ